MKPGAEKMFAQKKADEKTQIGFGTGVIVRNSEGKILLELRADCGLWGTPGGRVDPGESIEQSARREVREETGLEVRITRLLGVYSGPEDRIITYPDNGDVRHKVDVFLEAEITGGTLAPSLESERLEFFDPSHLPAELHPAGVRPLWDYAAGHFGVVA